MSRIEQKTTLFIIFFVFTLGIVAAGLSWYSEHQRDRLHDSTEMTLDEIVEQQIFNFTTIIQAEKDILHILSLAISGADGQEAAKDILAKSLEGNLSKFQVVAAFDLEERGITDKNQEITFFDSQVFQEVIGGKTLVCGAISSLDSDKKMISISVPIIKNGSVVGVLTGAYLNETLNSMILPTFQGAGYTFVISKSGEILFHTQSEYVILDNGNMFDEFKLAEFHNYDNYDAILANVQEGEVGRSEYSMQGQLRHAHYAPIPSTEWYLFTVVPENIIAASHAQIIESTIILAVVIIIIFAISVIFILLTLDKSYKEKERHSMALEQVAYYDVMTGLPNLIKFKEMAKNVLQDNPGKSFVFAKIDMVNFKMVNQIYGFQVGDYLIGSMAAFISHVREGMGLDKVGAFARITADEFILMDEGTTIEETEFRRLAFERSFNEQVAHLLDGYKISFRYGRYFLEPGESDIDEAIERVNMAHRFAKTHKDINIFDYDKTVKERLLRTTNLEARMNSALEKGEFKIYLQPKYLLSTETIMGAEALVRWCEEGGNIISPGEFIPIFENNGFIVKLDFYMFEQACKVIRGWLDSGQAPVPISVNFSRLHLINPSFLDKLIEIADRYDVPRNYLEIELIESTILDNEDVLIALCDQLHSKGFALSMDDFGAGYSSLGLLKNLKVDTIKIDRSFFSDESLHRRSRAVIENMVRMAKELDIQTVAEGVETIGYIKLLSDIGCDIVQGFYYARPMPAGELKLPERSKHESCKLYL